MCMGVRRAEHPVDHGPCLLARNESMRSVGRALPLCLHQDLEQKRRNGRVVFSKSDIGHAFLVHCFSSQNRKIKK